VQIASKTGSAEHGTTRATTPTACVDTCFARGRLEGGESRWLVEDGADRVSAPVARCRTERARVLSMGRPCRRTMRPRGV